MAVLTSSLAAYALDFVVTLTDIVNLTDSVANNAKSASDTVQITDGSSTAQTPLDSLPLSDGTSSDGQTVADIVDMTDSTLSNGQTVADTVDIVDSTSRDSPARDEIVLSDFALPDSSAIDTVALSDNPLVESFIFHPVFASDTVAIDDDISPDSAVLDVVSVSDSSLVESFIFHAIIASDIVSVNDFASLFSSVLDTVAIIDAVSLFSSVLDVVSVSDISVVESFIFYGIFASDTVAIDDIASLFSAVLDVVAISESSSVQSNIFYAIIASDIVAISDAASLFSAAFDTVSIDDVASLFSSVIDTVAIDDIASVQSNIFYAITASDIVALGDLASLFSTAVDMVALSDTASLQSNLFYAIVASDIVSIIDAAAAFSSVIDIVEIVDAASLPVTSVVDIVDIAITTSLATAKSIVDQLAVGDSFFDIAATFSRIFSETLVLPDCIFTNESGLCSTVGMGTIVIGDAVQLMLGSLNNPAEQISAQDQLARNYTGGRSMPESMQTRDSEAMSAASPPPAGLAAIPDMPMITMAETETMEEIGLADPAVAVEVEGTWGMSAFDNENLESLLAAAGMPVYNVSTIAGSDGIEEMTMVLPTFLFSVEVDGEPSNDGVFLTPTVSDLPAGMQVMVPINARDSMDESPGPLGNMTLSFTPADSANNFTMMIAMLDDNPEQDVTDERPDGKQAFFLDVSFAGDFAGAAPSDEAFFEQAPRITFTITEEWAIENGVRLLGINLFLLDEATGEWIEIATRLPGAAVDGVYTYTATLPHLSTYVVTADRVRGGTDASEYAVSLSETLFITSSAGQGGSAGSEGRTVIKDLAESLSIVEVRPETLHQRVVTVDDVHVAVSIGDIRTAAAFGTAIVTLNFEFTNGGDATEELVIRYWYSGAGGAIYEDSLMVTVDAGASGSSIIEIPFSSAGVYDVMIEVASQGGTLATTVIVVEVPWLVVYLYVLVAIAVAVVAASIGIVVYAIRKSGGSK